MLVKSKLGVDEEAFEDGAVIEISSVDEGASTASKGELAAVIFAVDDGASRALICEISIPEVVEKVPSVLESR